MRFISSLIFTVALAFGAFWIWNNTPQVRDTVMNYVENGEYLILEARYSPEQIIKSHQHDMVTRNDQEIKTPVLTFHPYLLMEVKFLQGARKTTKEGVILWSLVDGEMVLDTGSWEMTHGFEDAINAGASKSDFKVIHALMNHRGSMTTEQLQNVLNAEPDTVKLWVNSAKRKHLVVVYGNQVQLHFQGAKFPVSPQTKINQWLVTKPYSHTNRVGKKYSQNQIERIVRSAFDNDFTVRNAKTIYLPVYNVEVVNPDGSVITSFWNALNGQRIDSHLIGSYE